MIFPNEMLGPYDGMGEYQQFQYEVACKQQCPEPVWGVFGASRVFYGVAGSVHGISTHFDL